MHVHGRRWAVARRRRRGSRVVALSMRYPRSRYRISNLAGFLVDVKADAVYLLVAMSVFDRLFMDGAGGKYR
jgi:hypothetical protein